MAKPFISARIMLHFNCHLITTYLWELIMGTLFKILSIAAVMAFAGVASAQHYYADDNNYGDYGSSTHYDSGYSNNYSNQNYYQPCTLTRGTTPGFDRSGVISARSGAARNYNYGYRNNYWSNYRSGSNSLQRTHNYYPRSRSVIERKVIY